ncbi:general secretion pathway protein D [Roseateles sp. YR242]|uniref:secretin N-terminal domain-containing protein n=1 Tax=Roseateles sp. YR242 TaxID=1855305 RepID=UPI0008C89721|nr:secretin N-terminal domain-containing protein [Roseateles sp. YR242]SEL57642.1 general secretion pathway protein D [Roseateles sp. YR242]
MKNAWSTAWRVQAALTIGAMALLVGCAGSQSFREGTDLINAGQEEQGLAKLEEAVRAEPRNAEFRIALAVQRGSVINRQLAVGDTAMREGRLTDAERAFRQVLSLDGANAMARQGLDALVVERRHRAAVVEGEALLKKDTEADIAQALDKLRPVLSENPTQREALNLKARLEAARARFVRPETRLAAIYRKPITLEFRDAPLRSVFDVVAKVSGLNFFFDREIRPDLKVTVLAKNTSIEDAIRLLLATNQLEQKVLNENTVLIYPNTPQKLKDYQALVVRSFYLTNADVKAVYNTIKTLVKTKDLVVDERLGIIMMRDTPEAVRMAERIVALQDLSDPEVILELEVMEIKRTRLLELGIQWPSQLTLAPLNLENAPLTLSRLRHLRGPDIGATVGNTLINARKEDSDGNVLTNPRVRVRNKEKAKILIGDRVPVITTTNTATGFSSESVSYLDVGLKLEVEPNIYLDDEVAIKVNLEVSSLVREVLSKQGSLSYQIGTRGASTSLRLRDGETQILAGLISDEDRSTGNRVPLLGDMPVAGRLFGSQKDDKQRSEIILSITPRIVRSLRRPELSNAEFLSGTESNVGAEELRLSVLPVADAKGVAVAPGGAAPAATGAAATTPPTATGSSAVAAASGRAPGALAAQGGPSSTTGVAAAVVPVAPDGAGAGPGGAPAAAGSLKLQWQAPAQVKVGEQFSAVLRLTSQGPLRGMPVLAGFDPQLLQVVNVTEGDYFRQGGAGVNFSQRVDPAQGRVFAAAVRQGTDSGINGTGGVLTVTFKAIKPGAARLSLMSATPEPQAAPLALPIEHQIKVVP